MPVTYAKRNLANISLLANKTRAAAVKWHEFLLAEGIDILIYDTLRSEAQQRKNVANGVSWTMRSYHLVGQALDFVPVKNGQANWNGYNSKDVQRAVAYANKLGFEWGGDWSGKNYDAPHLQFTKVAYGKDVRSGNAAKEPVDNGYMKINAKGDDVKALQKQLNILGFGLDVDGHFGDATDIAVKTMQRREQLTQDGIVGPKTQKIIKAAVAEKQAIKVPKSTIKAIGKIEIVNVAKAAFIVDKPNTNSKNLSTIAKGKTIQIAGSVPGWYEVIYGGERAYVNSKYGKLV